MKKFVVAALLCAAGAISHAALPQAPSASEAESLAKSLKILKAGEVGDLAGKATFKASEAYGFLDPSNTDKFLQVMGNPPRTTSVAIVARKTDWFGVLDFSPEGYVKDDEKLDADELLKGLKAGNADANEAKRKAGYPTMQLEGWALPPHYDRESKRLEWGTLLRDEKGNKVVNVSTRILGRSGITSAVLVTSPETMDADLKDFKVALKDFDYNSGEKYSEWKEGDKVAAYGLGALVLGGAAAAAASKGGLKAIGVAIAAACAALWGGVKKVFGKKPPTA